MKIEMTDLAKILVVAISTQGYEDSVQTIAEALNIAYSAGSEDASIEWWKGQDLSDYDKSFGSSD